jgi:hypothetical protein
VVYAQVEIRPEAGIFNERKVLWHTDLEGLNEVEYGGKGRNYAVSVVLSSPIGSLDNNNHTCFDSSRGLRGKRILKLLQENACLQTRWSKSYAI